MGDGGTGGKLRLPASSNSVPFLFADCSHNLTYPWQGFGEDTVGIEGAGGGPPMPGVANP